MRKKIILLLLAAALLLTGCSMRTADQMYALPRRSRQYTALQTQIDGAMTGLSYCAPVSGENRQTVQTADLNGDGTQEYLVFAKGSSERPLRILIFAQQNGDIALLDTIESNGTAFQQIEYVQMDDVPGDELVVGCQLSDQLLRSVSVYHFPDGKAQRLMNTNYSQFLMTDLDGDKTTELFVLRPGLTETDKGIAELYAMENGSIIRSNEAGMSEPPEKLKRILPGKLNDGIPAVYAACAVDEASLITDVFAWKNANLANISLSSEFGTSVKTLRNYYVYAEDIDSDGVVELPALISMVTFGERQSTQHHDIIRWYALESDGSEVDKQYTFHNFVEGWYMDLSPQWATSLTVISQGNTHELYIWNDSFDAVQKIMTILVLTGQDRESQSSLQGRILLEKTDSVIYAAVLESDCQTYGINAATVAEHFHLIRQEQITTER